MTITGSAKVVETVVQPAVPAIVKKGITISLDDAGEIRRLGRILLTQTGAGGHTGAFAQELAAALGFDTSNTAKQ